MPGLSQFNALCYQNTQIEEKAAQNGAFFGESCDDAGLIASTHVVTHENVAFARLFINNSPINLIGDSL